MKEKRDQRVTYTTTSSLYNEEGSVGIPLVYQKEVGRKRSLSYYIDISKLYGGRYKNTSFYAPEELYNEIDSLSRELGISKSSLMKAAFLLLLDSLGRLKKRPKVIYINLIDLEATKKPLQNLLSLVGIKARITKVAKSAKGSMLFIHLSDGRIIYLDIRERKGEVKKSVPHGLVTLEQFFVPEGFEIQIEGD